MRDIVIKPIGKNTQWYTGDKEKDDFFLEAQNNYANELLKFRGFLFLNDVNDMLGYARTKTGQFLGWRAGDEVKINRTDEFLEIEVSGDILDVLAEE